MFASTLIIIFLHLVAACILLFHFIITLSQNHPVSAAVIYLHPDYPNQIVPDANWSSLDFSSDPQGVVFAGALAENSVLVIKNIKAFGIEVNATLSRGCTVRIEGCIVNGNPLGWSVNNRSGIVVAPTIFRDHFDGKYSCSKTVRTSSSSSQSGFDHQVRVEIIGNTVRNFATGFQISTSGTVVQRYRDVVAAIAIYNLIVCHRSLGQNDRVFAHVYVSSNDIHVLGNALSLFAVSIYWMSRVESQSLEIFNSSSSTSSLFQTVVPLSSVNIINNIINATNSDNECRAIQVGFLNQDSIGWDATKNYFLQTSSSSVSVSPPTIYFIITENSFSLHGKYSTGLFVLGYSGNVSALAPSSNSPSSPRFFLNFSNQRSMSVSSVNSFVVVLHLINIKRLTRFQTTILYDRNNRDVALEQRSSFDSTYVALSSSRNDTTLIVTNSHFPFLTGGNGVSSAVSVSDDATIGSIIMKSNLVNAVPFLSRASRAFIFFFRSINWRYIGIVVVEGNIVEDTLHLHDVLWLIHLANVSGASDLSLEQLAPLEGTYGLGLGNLTVRNNKMIADTTFSCRMMQFDFVPRIGNVSVEGNTFTANCADGALMRRSGAQSCAIIAENLVVQNNVVDLTATGAGSLSYFVGMKEFVVATRGGKFLLQNNTFVTRGFTASIFFDGGFMADPADPNSSVILRNNFVRGDAVQSISFIGQTLKLNPPSPLHQFNMKRIIVQGNKVNVTSRMTAGFISSVVGTETATDVSHTIPSQVIWVFDSNNVEVSSSLGAGAIRLGNQYIKELHFINTTFVIRNRLDPPVLPPSLQPVAALLVPECRFSSFTRSNISQVFLSSSSSSTSTKSCSSYNAMRLTDKLFNKMVSTELTGIGVRMSGEGVPMALREVVPGACAFTLSPSISFSESARSLSLTISLLDNRKTRTLTKKLNHHHRHYESPLPKSSLAISSTTVIASSFIASAALASSALQTRAILTGVNSILDGSCRISQETLEEQPDISSSPLQLYIGGGYASGTVIGNFSFIIVFLILWHGAFLVVQKVFNKKISLRPFALQSFADSKILSPAILLSMMFLDPLVNSTVVVLAVPGVLTGLKVICTLMLVVFLVLFGVVVFKLLFSRRVCEKFERTTSGFDGKSKNVFIKFYNFLMGVEGKWKCTEVGKSHREKGETRGGFKVTKHDALSFQLAVLLIEGYTDRFPRFVVCDILAVFGVALGTVVGHLADNCTVLGVIQILAIAVHTFLAILFRPDQELLLRLAVPLVGVVQIILLSIALAGVNQDSVAGLALFLVSMQLTLTAILLFSFALLLKDELLKQCRWKATPPSKQGSRRNDDDDDDHDENLLQEFVHQRPAESSDRRSRSGNNNNRRFDHSELRANERRRSSRRTNDDEEDLLPRHQLPVRRQQSGEPSPSHSIDISRNTKLTRPSSSSFLPESSLVGRRRDSNRSVVQTTSSSSPSRHDDQKSNQTVSPRIEGEQHRRDNREDRTTRRQQSSGNRSSSQQEKCTTKQQ